jgi:hypothetical protein
MSMTTVAQPTSNAEWQCRLAMAISHPFGRGQRPAGICFYTWKILPINPMQQMTQKACFSAFSLFQLISG